MSWLCFLILQVYQLTHIVPTYIYKTGCDVTILFHAMTKLKKYIIFIPKPCPQGNPSAGLQCRGCLNYAIEAFHFYLSLETDHFPKVRVARV